jgi:hypothetical protein
MPSLISSRCRELTAFRFEAGSASARRLVLIVLGSLTAWTPLAARAEAPAAQDPIHRVESRVRAWYSVLGEQRVESCALEQVLGRSQLEFSLSEDGTPKPAGLAAWVSELRSSHPQVEYQLTNVRTQAVGDDTYRLRLSVDRRALDAAGVPHVARREQTWLIRDRSGAPPLVLRIDDERRLVFPGTGPQIVCY